MKEFTVVFPYGFDPQGHPALLLGQQPPGKPFHDRGYFNGPGGKIDPEVDASAEEGAQRELAEELISKSGHAPEGKVIRIGKIINDDKIIHLFMKEVPWDSYQNTEGMMNYTWFPLADMSFVKHMLPGDEPIILFIRKNFVAIHSGLAFPQLLLKKEGEQIREVTKFL